MSIKVEVKYILKPDQRDMLVLAVFIAVVIQCCISNLYVRKDYISWMIEHLK